MNIAVLGAGAWGTALAIKFAERHQVILWTREAERVPDMRTRRENTRYLPNIHFPDGLAVESDLGAAVRSADLAIIATPTAGLRPTLENLRAGNAAVPVVWVCKGFEAGGAKLPHQVVAEAYDGQIPCAVLSGPSFAQEVAQGLPTAVTLASEDARFANRIARELHSARLRVYSSTDITGVEVGGAVKNVMAIAAGICDGLGFGHNARAALITRGLAEITRLGLALGGKAETFMGLAGVGDLILTCTGDLSRNRRVGLGLAGGKSLDAVLAELGHVAEGVYTARETDRLAREHGVDMPITRAVCRVLYENVPARAAVEELLAREPKAEN
jgi:glycerol-3-phosphate dehydrogenase (NAD(P)+)